MASESKFSPVSAGLRVVRRAVATLATLVVLAASATATAETVLITGSSSGLGLEFARQYAKKGWDVIATHPHDGVPEDLGALRAQYPRVRIEQLDVTNEEQISALAQALKGRPIDVLLNNAGVMTLDNWARGLGAGQRFGDLDFDSFDRIMDINAKGSMRVTQAFYDNVLASRQKKIVAITSSLGSNGDPPETTTNSFWYSTSKAALNKLMSLTARATVQDGVIVVPMHPGSVRVRGTGPLPDGMIEAPFSVGEMIRTIDGLTIERSGSFLNYDGTPIPW